MSKRSGSYSFGTYMDRSGQPPGKWQPPSLIVETTNRLRAGADISEVWRDLDGRTTYRTLLRWKKSPPSRRYRLAVWWLKNRGRIETLERRGLSRNEILAKIGEPPDARRASGKRNRIKSLYWLWATFRHMEEAENERWMGRAA